MMPPRMSRSVRWCWRTLTRGNEAALELAALALAQGQSVFVFPEGTSSLGPRHLPYRRGAARSRPFPALNRLHRAEDLRPVMLVKLMKTPPRGGHQSESGKRNRNRRSAIAPVARR